MTLKYFEGPFSLSCHFHVHFSNSCHAIASHGLPAIAELLVQTAEAQCAVYWEWDAMHCRPLMVCSSTYSKKWKIIPQAPHHHPRQDSFGVSTSPYTTNQRTLQRLLISLLYDVIGSNNVISDVTNRFCPPTLALSYRLPKPASHLP